MLGIGAPRRRGGERQPAQLRASHIADVIQHEDWAQLRARMERRSYQPGDVIIEQGTLQPEFHIVEEGVVSVSAIGPRGERRELGALGAGEPVGEMSLLTGEPASADVIAATNVETYAISREALVESGEMRARLIEVLASMVANRLKHANDRLVAERAAALHWIVLSPADFPPLQALPAQIERITGGSTLAILAGDGFSQSPARQAIGGMGVAHWTLTDADVPDLPRTLTRVSFDYDRILVFAPAPPDAHLAERAASVVRVVHPGERVASGDVIAIASQRWTPPVVRDLSARIGARVIGIVPPQPGPPGPHDPVAKLARVITGRQVGLALGAGAAKGIAHIGVLRALDELGVSIDMIGGSSIGAAIAGGWAAGYTVDDLSEVAKRITARAVRPTLPIHSFLSSKGIRDELERIGAGRRLEDLDIPIVVNATDLFRRCDVTFTEGLAWPRLLASMAIPGIYPAVRGIQSYLVDGGVLNPVPSRQVRDLGAGIVIGVRLTGARTSPRENLEVEHTRPLAAETIIRSLEIMQNRLSELSRHDANISIEVQIERGGLRDFSHATEIAQAGYDATRSSRDELAALIPYIAESATTDTPAPAAAPRAEVT